MHIEIIAVGQKMPDWVNRGYADYADRLTGDLTLGLTEIPLQKRGSASQLAAAQNKEAAQIRSALHACDHIVTLDIPGREHSSESLAARKLVARQTDPAAPAGAHYRRRSALPCLEHQPQPSLPSRVRLVI